MHDRIWLIEQLKQLPSHELAAVRQVLLEKDPEVAAGVALGLAIEKHWRRKRT